MHSIIVTGASRGIGLGIARALTASGHQVIGIARTPTGAFEEAARDAARKPGGPALHFRPADLADLARLPALVHEIQKEFGPIHGLVNNAALGTSGLLANTPDHAIEQLIRVNVVAPLTLTKHVVRAMMLTRSGGRIVNISSIVSYTGFSGLAAYAASKSALIGMTRSLAREVGPLGITVNAVTPGFIETEMTHGLKGEDMARIVRRSPLGRLAEITDIANAVDYLMSEKARNITGTVLTVDAGGTA